MSVKFKMKSTLKLLFILSLCCLFLGLSGCAKMRRPAQTLPMERIGLQLPPASLGKTIALQQHLTVVRAGQVHELDTVLEINPKQLNLVGMMLGRRVMTLTYDGKTLSTWRDPHMPSQITGEEILEDIELSVWPENVLRASLPKPWKIKQKHNTRIIYLNRQPITIIKYYPNKIILKNTRYQYTLTIQSAPL
jgi:hypothetical protein